MLLGVSQARRNSFICVFSVFWFRWASLTYVKPLWDVAGFKENWRLLHTILVGTWVLSDGRMHFQFAVFNHFGRLSVFVLMLIASFISRVGRPSSPGLMSQSCGHLQTGWSYVYPVLITSAWISFCKWFIEWWRRISRWCRWRLLFKAFRLSTGTEVC